MAKTRRPSPLTKDPATGQLLSGKTTPATHLERGPLDSVLLRGKAVMRGKNLAGAGLGGSEPLGGVGGGLGKLGKAAPWLLGTAPWLLDMAAGPLMKYGMQGQLLDRDLQLQQAQTQGAAIRARHRQQLNALVQQNMALLSQQSPALAQQLMAGYVLPEDATVIGGQPRMDLLRNVATRMASGEFSRPGSPLPDSATPGFPLGPDPMMQGQQPQQQGGVA